jgi:hypothetical protein
LIGRFFWEALVKDAFPQFATAMERRGPSALLNNVGFGCCRCRGATLGRPDRPSDRARPHHSLLAAPLGRSRRRGGVRRIAPARAALRGAMEGEDIGVCPLGPAVTLTARPSERLFRLVLESHDGRCYGAAARILHSIVADVNRWSAPMQNLNDLSRSLTARERHRHCGGGGKSESA